MASVVSQYLTQLTCDREPAKNHSNKWFYEQQRIRECRQWYTAAFLRCLQIKYTNIENIFLGRLYLNGSDIHHFTPFSVCQAVLYRKTVKNERKTLCRNGGKNRLTHRMHCSRFCPNEHYISIWIALNVWQPQLLTKADGISVLFLVHSSTKSTLVVRANLSRRLRRSESVVNSIVCECVARAASWRARLCASARIFGHSSHYFIRFSLSLTLALDFRRIQIISGHLFSVSYIDEAKCATPIVL